MTKQSGDCSTRSPDLMNCLDDDTLIAKTILGMSTLQLDMMGRLKKLEENQNVILEEARLERAKCNSVVETLEKHYDKEMGRFMDMVNIIVGTVNRRDQSNVSQSEATRTGSQNVPVRPNAVQGIVPGYNPSMQPFNATSAPSTFFAGQNVPYNIANSLQSFPGFANTPNINQQQIPNLQQLLQCQFLQQQIASAQASQQALAQAQQISQTQTVPIGTMGGVRGVQPGIVSFDGTSYPCSVPAFSNTPSILPVNSFTSSSLPPVTKPPFASAKQATQITVSSSSVTPKTTSTPGVPAFKLPTQEASKVPSAMPFKPVNPDNVFGGTVPNTSATIPTTTSGESQLASALNEQKSISFQPGNLASAGNSARLFSIFEKTTLKKFNDSKLIKQEEDVEDFVPTAHFEPVIPLPALVEAKTGEEEENVLFKSRSKLYRFVKTSNEYKERGVGDIKILQSKDGKCRIVMRRDQVLKVCANVPLLPGMKIEKKPGTENSCIWACKDYSESVDGTSECFVARFKTSQLADEFIKIFQEAANAINDEKKIAAEKKEVVSDAASCKQLRNLLSQSDFENSSTTRKGELSTSQKSNEVTEKVEQGFGDAFKPAPGSWECNSCYTRNKAEASVCPCCGTKKDGSIPSSAANSSFSLGKSVAVAPPIKEGAFSFGITTGVPFPKGPSATTTSGGVSSPGNISFGFSTPNMTTTASTTHGTTGSVSASGLPSFSFSSLSSTKSTPSSSASTFTFSTTNVPSGSKPETTAAAPVTTKPLFSFAKPILSVSTASSANSTASTFSFASSVFKSPAQDASKGPSSFSFKPADMKGNVSGPTFGEPPVFGGKTIVSSSTTTPQSAPKEASPAPAKSGNSLFGASAGASPFSSSVFGGTSSGGFAALAAKAQSENKTVETTSSERKITPFQGGSFGNADKFAFSIGSKQSATENDSKAAKGEDDAEEFVPTAHFEPVVALPPVVETKTGEEDEKVLFKARGKLYRYIKESNEYKERGVGEVKILQNNAMKCRIVMRREQVLKVCVNAPIISGMVIDKKQGTENACIWACKDYSEKENGINECFVIRFKTAQLADEFINVFCKVANEISERGAKDAIEESKEPTAVKDAKPSSSRATSESLKPPIAVASNQEEVEDEDYEELKDYPATIRISDAFPSPMKPAKQLEIKGVFAIGIRHDVNVMEVDVLNKEGESQLTHLIGKDDKFNTQDLSTLDYFTTDLDGKNVKVTVIFDSQLDKDGALTHLRKGANMAAENDD